MNVFATSATSLPTETLLVTIVYSVIMLYCCCKGKHNSTKFHCPVICYINSNIYIHFFCTMIAVSHFYIHIHSSFLKLRNWVLNKLTITKWQVREVVTRNYMEKVQMIQSKLATNSATFCSTLKMQIILIDEFKLRSIWIC